MLEQSIQFWDRLEDLTSQEDHISSVKEAVEAGNVLIVRNVISKTKCLEIREYLASIARGSLPNYRAIEATTPNFHRIDRWDPRATVSTCMHSFSFFPWNQDVFGLFDLFAPIFHLKNQIAGLPADRFLSVEPERGCTARISGQFYPKGIGGMHRHQDPVDYHQLTVPMLYLSRKGEDFFEGGLFIEDENEERICIDDLCDYGDVVFFNASCSHGVDTIDPRCEENWLSFEGRWILLFPINKLAGNDKIAKSIDLNES